MIACWNWSSFCFRRKSISYSADVAQAHGAEPGAQRADRGQAGEQIRQRDRGILRALNAFCALEARDW